MKNGQQHEKYIVPDTLKIGQVDPMNLLGALK